MEDMFAGSPIMLDEIDRNKTWYKEQLVGISILASTRSKTAQSEQQPEPA
jgi:hypothetical protein